MELGVRYYSSHNDRMNLIMEIAVATPEDYRQILGELDLAREDGRTGG